MPLRSDRGGIFYFMETDWADSFREKLDQHYTWPSLYVFKFIVPTGKEKEVRTLLPIAPTKEKRSANGTYTSVTFEISMQSSGEVVDIYIKASLIEGLIAL